jgi:hypothetical protein
MSSGQTPSQDEQLYWELVESFIESANAACDKADPGVVSAAMLNAVARFNAFIVAHSSLDRKEFAEDIDGTLNYLTGRYRDFLKSHLEDYHENYKTWIRADDAPDEE